MAEADSNGTPVIDSDSDADTGFDFAADLAADARTESSTTDSTPSRDAGTPDFDPSAVDIGTAAPESLPEPYRKAQEWAKNRERELQGVMTRSTQETADLRRQMANLQTSVNAQQQAAVPAQDPLADLRQRLGEDAGAVDVVSDIVKAVSSDTSQAQQSQAQQLQMLQQAVAAMAQSMVSEQSTGLNQQVVEARAVYGGELDGYADQIKALISVRNPATQAGYTVKEAYELVSGKAAAKSQELSQTERQVRSDASHQTALSGAVGAANSGDGELSPTQLQAGLRKLGFE